MAPNCKNSQNQETTNIDRFREGECRITLRSLSLVKGRHMVEFLVQTDCPLGKQGQYVRRFLDEAGYDTTLEAQKLGHIRICKYGNIIEGHILPDKPKKRRR